MHDEDNDTEKYSTRTHARGTWCMELHVNKRMALEWPKENVMQSRKQKDPKDKVYTSKQSC